jgi:anti-sigma B factor antagonist
VAASGSDGRRVGGGKTGMTIEERPTGDVMILDLKGKLTIGDGDELLKDKINSLVQQGHTKLILNLAEVPYIDSGGLGQVVRTYTTVKQHNGSLKLMNVTKRIEDLLAITKLLTVFDVFETEQEALQSFA